jgi:hypothetical protein
LKNLFLISVFLVLVSGCSKIDPSDYSLNLAGKWSWIQSCPGMGYSACWSPGSLYPSYDILFDIDSTYKVFHGDTLISSCKFHTFRHLNDQNRLVYIISYESGSTDMYLISHDTLHMTNSEGVITITSRYKRIK